MNDNELCICETTAEEAHSDHPHLTQIGPWSFQCKECNEQIDSPNLHVYGPDAHLTDEQRIANFEARR